MICNKWKEMKRFNVALQHNVYFAVDDLNIRVYTKREKLNFLSIDFLAFLLGFNWKIWKYLLHLGHEKLYLVPGAKMLTENEDSYIFVSVYKIKLVLYYNFFLNSEVIF